MSADDGAVDALLCLDEASAEDALVKLDPPLPLLVSQYCDNITSSGCTAAPLGPEEMPPGVQWEHNLIYVPVALEMGKHIVILVVQGTRPV